MADAVRCHGVTGHPCFDDVAVGYRAHLPVAGQCNLSCRYCRPRLQSRPQGPGSAQRLLEPDEAVEQLGLELEQMGPSPVVGVAGPGDPLASAGAVFETFRLVGKLFPSAAKCMCTNGIALPDHYDSIMAAGIDYLTLTVNACRPEVLALLYRGVFIGGRFVQGIDAAAEISSRQRTAIQLMVQSPIRLKVNVVVIPGVNDEHLDELLTWLSDGGVRFVNLIPLLPIPGTDFERSRTQTRRALLDRVQSRFPHLKFKRHCARCAADARGYVQGG